jgi:sulfonate transport system substrate-binding protein
MKSNSAILWALTVFILIAAVSSIGCSKKGPAKPEVVKLDFAYYNPISLVLKEKKFLEEDLGKENIKVGVESKPWQHKALELLNSKSTDFGSTAGASALIGKANGNPIKSVYVYSKLNGTALVVRKDSSISKIEDLKGKKVAVTLGTDPYIFSSGHWTMLECPKGHRAGTAPAPRWQERSGEGRRRRLGRSRPAYGQNRG